MGKITDGGTAEELIGANVSIYRNGALVSGASTDFEGNYSVKLDPGLYDVEISYIGYQSTKVKGVVIQTGQANKLDVQMGTGGVINSNRRVRRQRQQWHTVPYHTPSNLNNEITREELFNKAKCEGT